MFDVYRNSVEDLKFSRGRPRGQDGPRRGIFIARWRSIERVLSWRERSNPLENTAQGDLGAEEKAQC